MGADMDCAQIKKTLLDGNSLALPEAQRHLEECLACRTLAEDGGELAHFLAAAEPPVALALSGDSFKKLEDQLAREKGLSGRLMSLPTALRELLACTALFIPIAIGVAKLRPDLALYPSVRFLAEIALLAGLAAAAGWVWLRPLHRPRPQTWVVLAILGLGLFVPWLLAALPPAHANQVGVTNNFAYQAAACFFSARRSLCRSWSRSGVSAIAAKVCWALQCFPLLSRPWPASSVLNCTAPSRPPRTSFWDTRPSH